MTIDELQSMLNQQMGGLASGYLQPVLHQTLKGEATERPANNFVGLAQQAYAANGVVFSCMLVRQLVFSSVRFNYQRLREGKPSDMFSTAELHVLERPWVGGTTQDMLSQMIQDADLAGNSYWVRGGTRADELIRLRPDWVEIVGRKRHLAGRNGRPQLGNRGNGQVGWEKIGYLYTEGGPGNSDPVPFTAAEVCHFAPIPDPLSPFAGMSWLTPILREIQADQAMTNHQRKFFDNAATPNMIIKHPQGAQKDAVERWVEDFADQYKGVENAYKSLQLYPGADAEVVGANLKDIDFKDVRGGGETRIAAAAGVPPVIVGLSEGLAAATYSNYGQARRRLADGTAHPLWQNLASCLENVVPNLGADVRLWYDASDVPFLREDEKDAAEIQKTRAETINSLIAAGYAPESVVAAVEANDLRLLVHTGLTSVQLQAPGAGPPPPEQAPTEPEPAPTDADTSPTAEDEGETE
ncbi:phage portal protein [Gordonia sp. OPL2]|uniref:phage portal protein n=1 Tax=Gordonia sp. OPL2 TaxID=2486274 RepID=UPI0021CCB0BE|nr:phage portal protein [Gordonia sp. OPL2]